MSVLPEKGKNKHLKAEILITECSLTTDMADYKQPTMGMVPAVQKTCRNAKPFQLVRHEPRRMHARVWK